MIRIALSLGHYIRRRSTGALVYDPGAINGHITEEATVSRIGQAILACIDDSRFQVVVIPRTHLEDRVAIINMFHTMEPLDLTMEIHMNAFTIQKVSGTEVLHWDGSQLGEKYAKIMSEQISRRILSRNRGPKARSDLAFLRGTIPPAIMTEAEFITNPTVAMGLERHHLVNSIAQGHIQGLNYIAEAICKGG